MLTGTENPLTVLRIRDVYPGSWFLSIPDLGSRIPDPKTGTKEKGEKNLLSYLFCIHKYKKKLKLLYFWIGAEKNLGQFINNYRFGIRKKPIPDPGSVVKKALDAGSRSTTLPTKVYI